MERIVALGHLVVVLGALGAVTWLTALGKVDGQAAIAVIVAVAGVSVAGSSSAAASSAAAKANGRAGQADGPA